MTKREKRDRLLLCLRTGILYFVLSIIVVVVVAAMGRCAARQNPLTKGDRDALVMPTAYGQGGRILLSVREDVFLIRALDGPVATVIIGKSPADERAFLDE